MELVAIFSFVNTILAQQCSKCSLTQNQNQDSLPKSFPPRVISSSLLIERFTKKGSIVFNCGSSGNVVFTAALYWIDSLQSILFVIITALHPCGSDSTYWTKKSTALELVLSSFVRSGTVRIDRALCAVIFFKCLPFPLYLCLGSFRGCFLSWESFMRLTYFSKLNVSSVILVRITVID